MERSHLGVGIADGVGVRVGVAVGVAVGTFCKPTPIAPHPAIQFAGEVGTLLMFAVVFPT